MTYITPENMRQFKQKVACLIEDHDLADLWEFGICYMTEEYHICEELFQECLRVEGQFAKYGTLTEERIYVLLLLDTISAKDLYEMIK